ncbi:MAG: hypothetical protein HMLKMBBP_00141 [Planctomycetes bacterium]|nr:hypothetical protein [Planctomycetota bacterium]
MTGLSFPDRRYEPYVTSIEGVPAMVLADLAAIEGGPDPSRPALLRVRIAFLEAGAEGFRGEREEPRFAAMEEALVAAVESRLSARWAGRISRHGYAEYAFYCRDARSAAPVVQGVLDRHRPYRFRHDVEDDPAWDYLRSFLAPGPKEMHQIRSRHVRVALDAEGDDPSIPRQIDHFAHFASPADRDAVRADLEKLGFVIGESGTAPDGRATLAFHQVAPADLRTVSAAGYDAIDACAARGGTYDGWGCKVTRRA